MHSASQGQRRKEVGGRSRHEAGDRDRRWCVHVRPWVQPCLEKCPQKVCRNSDGFAEVQTLPTLISAPEVAADSQQRHRAVTTVCSMPLLQKRKQVFERVFCAYVQPATHCRCCAPAAASVQLETMTKAPNPFPVRRKSNGHPRSVFHSSTA